MANKTKTWIDNIKNPWRKKSCQKAFDSDLSFRVSAMNAETKQMKKILGDQAEKRFPTCPINKE
jgi:hypothetical protein